MEKGQSVAWFFKNKWNLVLLLVLLTIESAYAQEKMLRFDNISNDGLLKNSVHGIVQDKYGFMWFGAWSGLCRYDGYKFKIYRADANNPRSVYSNRTETLYKDNENNIWIGYKEDIVCRYNYNSDDFTWFSRSDLPKNISDSLIRSSSIFYTYIKTKNYSWMINQLESPLAKNIPINKIDNLLIQTNRQTGNQIVYRIDPFNRNALKDDYVYTIFLDDNQILWVGTNNGGISTADTKQNQIYHYFQTQEKNNSIIDNVIRSICEDNEGNLWIGTHNKGITKIDSKKNKYTHYQYNENNQSNSLVSNQIRKIYCDRFGYMWIGTKTGGLDRFNPKTNQFVHYSTTSKNKIPSNSIYAIMEDHSGYLWIGTFNGIAKFDRKKDTFLPYKVNYNSSSQRIRVILEDRKYNLWVASDGGGFACLKRDSSEGFNEKVTIAHYYVNSSSNLNSLSVNYVYSMVEDENGIFWLGTGIGLNRFDPETEKFTHFNGNMALPDDMILGIINDRSGHLWMSHKKGITKFTINTFATQNYTVENGLQDNEFSEDAYFRSNKTGKLYFGGINGLNAFYPDDLKDDTTLPKTYITDLQIQNRSVKINESVNGRIILTKPIFLTKEITLTYADNIIAIEFAGLHYANPKNNKYAYMLDGFDQNWVYSDASMRIAKYSNLNPGTYTFRVKSSNNTGKWNNIPAELKIIVLPSWWQTIIFRISLIVLFLLLVFLFFYWRVATYRKKEIELNLLIKKRTEELELKNNDLLKERRKIVEQTGELQAHTVNLINSNKLLIQKQKLIQLQSEKLQETNQQLSVLNSTKDKFFSIIAHDLRNPFHTVMGFSELLLLDLERFPLEKTKKYLGLIHSTSQKGNDLLENLLQWSRTETGKISFEPENLNLYSVAENTINLLDVLAQRKSIKIIQEIDTAITVLADENMLKTILRNLISNAIKFTHENGTIVLKATNIKPNVEISVIDNGVGIKEENIKLLFLIESNISTKGTLYESGTGLGLILCKEFVEKHGGKIWVESKEGKGSEFKFTLSIG